MDPICEECGLYAGCKSPFMSGAGSECPTVLLVGEAPGATEDTQGIPFVGKSGQLLRTMVSNAGLEDSDVRYTNTVRCRPPNNRDPTQDELKYCSQFLEQEIKEFNPSVIALLGNSPLKSVLGQSGITNWNGTVVERENHTYVPLFHPAYVLRNGSRGTVLDEWVAAFSRVVDSLNGKKFDDEKDYEYIFPLTIKELEEMFQEINAYDGKFITCDMESVSINIKHVPLADPNYDCNVLLSVGFSTDNKAWAYPIEHKDFDWSDEEFEKVCNITEQILLDKNVVGHNIRSDLKIFRHLYDMKFIPYNDTLRQSQLINPYQGGHSLKRLAGIHVGMYDYDRELSDYIEAHPECGYSWKEKVGNKLTGRTGHYGNIPLDILLRYNAKDVVATSLLYHKLDAELTDKQRIFCKEIIMNVDYCLGLVEENGFRIDPYLSKVYMANYSAERDRYYVELCNDTDVQDFITHKLETNKKFIFNPNSDDQLRQLLYGYDKPSKKFFDEYKAYDPVGYTAKSGPAVNKDIQKIHRDACKEEDKIFFENLRMYLLMLSMMSKCIRPANGQGNSWLDNDGKVRSSFNIGGAKTGRLSSSKPNLQNIPTPEKEPGTLLASRPVKNMFTHTWIRHDSSRVKKLYDHNLDGFDYESMIGRKVGPHQYEVVMPNIIYDDGSDGCLLDADYSGAELRIAAMISGCEGLKEAFLKDMDPHCYVTRRIFPFLIDMSDKEIKTKYKEYRYRAKWCNWTFLYGGSAFTLMNMYGLEQDIALKLEKDYFEAFPEIKLFQTNTKKFLRKHGYVETPFGRRLPLPDIWNSNRSISSRAERTAINAPNQGTASDVTLMAAAIIQLKMDKLKLRSMLVNTVHDSIIADIYPGEVTIMKDTFYDVMTNVTERSMEYFPSVDVSWMGDIPMKCDIDFGTHYGSHDESKQIEYLNASEITTELHNRLHVLDSRVSTRTPRIM